MHVFKGKCLDVLIKVFSGITLCGHLFLPHIALELPIMRLTSGGCLEIGADQLILIKAHID